MICSREHFVHDSKKDDRSCILFLPRTHTANDRRSDGTTVHVGENTCVESHFMLKEGDRYEMAARRSEPNSIRGYQKLLRTRLKAWGVDLPDKQQGWLRLLTNEEYSQIVYPKPKPSPPQCNNGLFPLPVNLITAKYVPGGRSHLPVNTITAKYITVQ